MLTFQLFLSTLLLFKLYKLNGDSSLFNYMSYKAAIVYVILLVILLTSGLILIWGVDWSIIPFIKDIIGQL